MNKLLISAVILAAMNLAVVRPALAQAKAKPKEREAPAVIETQSPTKSVTYSKRDIVRLRCKLRFTTTIVLPDNEKILEIIIGDKNLWVVNAAENMAYIKPAKSGAETNLNLVAASGNLYSFVLSEIGEDPKAQPELMVFVELKDTTMIGAAGGPARFVAASEVASYHAQLERAKQEVASMKAASQSAIEAGTKKFIDNVRFPYRFESGKKPFNVRAMYSDDKFTYIQARPEETPAL
jgi:type IV secretory pathway VirB9-like protein